MTYTFMPLFPGFECDENCYFGLLCLDFSTMKDWTSGQGAKTNLFSLKLFLFEHFIAVEGQMKIPNNTIQVSNPKE